MTDTAFVNISLAAVLAVTCPYDSRARHGRGHGQNFKRRPACNSETYAKTGFGRPGGCVRPGPLAPTRRRLRGTPS